MLDYRLLRYFQGYWVKRKHRRQNGSLWKIIEETVHVRAPVSFFSLKRNRNKSVTNTKAGKCVLNETCDIHPSLTRNQTLQLLKTITPLPNSLSQCRNLFITKCTIYKIFVRLKIITYIPISKPKRMVLIHINCHRRLLRKQCSAQLVINTVPLTLLWTPQFSRYIIQFLYLAQ